MSWFKDRRLGKFEIDADIIDENPEIVRAIMGTCIPLHADLVLQNKAVEYVAICEGFDELPEGEVIPSYDMEYDPDTQAVSWTRQGT